MYAHSDIRIGIFKGIKVQAAKWKCSVSNFTDTATISVALRSYARNAYSDEYIKKNAAIEAAIAQLPDDQRTIFSEGDKVEIRVGYDDASFLRFKGFVKVIDYSTPLNLQCEGYSYCLKDIMVTKSYRTTTVKDILQDLVKGTEIKLSDSIPHIALKNVVFKNCSGLKVLEWLQKECLLAVFFDFEELYVGSTKYGIKKGAKKIRLQWNTTNDVSLKKDVKDTNIVIKLTEKNTAGETKKTKSEQLKYSSTQEVKIRPGMSDVVLKQIANDLQTQKNYAGYKGKLTCFLIPVFEKCAVVKIESNTYPDMQGDYFVEEVSGQYSPSGGGRQVLSLIYNSK